MKILEKVKKGRDEKDFYMDGSGFFAFYVLASCNKTNEVAKAIKEHEPITVMSPNKDYS